MSAAELRRARIGVALTFLVTGVVFGTWSARLPAIKQALDLSDGGLGVAFMGLNAGAVAGLQLGGALVPLTGSRTALRVALPVYAAALAGPALAGDLATLTAALFALGGVNSVVDVAMNAHGVIVERGYRRPVMSSFHAMYSLGGTGGAALGVLAAAAGLGRTPHFLVVAAAGLAGLGLFGAGLSLTFPLAISAAGRQDGAAAVAVARISTLGYLGAFLGPGLIGALAGPLGLSAALGVPAALVTGAALAARAVAPAGDRAGRGAMAASGRA